MSEYLGKDIFKLGFGLMRLPKLEDGSIDIEQTKVMVDMLKAVNAGRKALVVLDGPNDTVVKSLGNIAGVKVAYTNTLNVYDILNCDTIVFAQNAVQKLEEVYA